MTQTAFDAFLQELNLQVEQDKVAAVPIEKAQGQPREPLPALISPEAATFLVRDVPILPANRAAILRARQAGACALYGNEIRPIQAEMLGRAISFGSTHAVTAVCEDIPFELPSNTIRAWMFGPRPGFPVNSYVVTEISVPGRARHLYNLHKIKVRQEVTLAGTTIETAWLGEVDNFMSSWFAAHNRRLFVCVQKTGQVERLEYLRAFPETANKADLIAKAPRIRDHELVDPSQFPRLFSVGWVEAMVRLEQGGILFEDVTHESGNLARAWFPAAVREAALFEILSRYGAYNYHEARERARYEFR